MKIYLILVPLFLVVACSKRVEDDSFKVLIPWPTESGGHSLQVVNVETLTDIREMKGSAAELFVQPGLGDTAIEGVKPNAQFTKSSKGYWVPKDTITQEMVAIYAHMERLKELDQEIGIDILLSWPRKIGVETIANDGHTKKRIYENAMYISQQDVMLFFPYRVQNLPVSLNAGIIAHEHFHAIFQRILLDPLGLKVDIEELYRGYSTKPQSQEEITKKEVAANNLFILRGLNEGLADVWGSIYTGQSDYISQTLSTLTRSTSPSQLSDVRALQSYVPFMRATSSPQSLESSAYTLGTQYARLMRKAMGEEKLSSSKMGQAIFVIEKLTKLRDILIDSFESKIPSEVLIHAIYKKEELNKENCEWIHPLVAESKSEYDVTCNELALK